LDYQEKLKQSNSLMKLSPFITTIFGKLVRFISKIFHIIKDNEYI